jgi:Mrp family chromosome partitioning ATPase
MSQTLDALKRIESRREWQIPKQQPADEVSASAQTQQPAAAVPPQSVPAKPQAKLRVAAAQPVIEQPPVKPAAPCPVASVPCRTNSPGRPSSMSPEPPPDVSRLISSMVDASPPQMPDAVVQSGAAPIIPQTPLKEALVVESTACAFAPCPETQTPKTPQIPPTPTAVSEAGSPQNTDTRQTSLSIKKKGTIRWPYQPASGIQYERLATTLLAQPSLQRPAAVMFTSPGDGDGKSDLLVALAPFLAGWTERDTLLVDADFYHSDVSTRLAAFNEGLIGLIARRTEIAEVVCSTTMPHLSVLPQGSPSMLEHGLHDLPALQRVLHDLKSRYPLVLLDSPSLSYPLVASMGECCDGVCLVVRPGHTARRAIRKAANLIAAAGGQFLGCIVIGE